MFYRPKLSKHLETYGIIAVVAVMMLVHSAHQA